MNESPPEDASAMKAKRPFRNSWWNFSHGGVFARKKVSSAHRIQISLRDLSQLFNSMDPSPFHEKDLDHDAEEFIESWVSEFPVKDEVGLVIHVEQWPNSPEARAVAGTAIQNYFAYKAQLNEMEFSRLMKQGRASLLIGFTFLAVCLLLSQLVARFANGTLQDLVRESLLIAGWVALWKPMDIYLYGWWPLRRRGVILRKMSLMQVELRKADYYREEEPQNRMRLQQKA